MARMYPPMLDPNDTRIPRSERVVFDALRDQLDNDFVVFHSAVWLGKGDRNELSDGEADFVVGHPNLGILVLEIKGGSIRFEPNTSGGYGPGQWYSVDHFNQVHKLKHDPFDQVKRNKYALIKKIDEIPEDGQKKFSYGHAVIFPDVYGDLPVLPAKVDKNMFIDGRDMSSLARRIVEVYRSWRGDYPVRPLGEDGVALLVSLLSPTLEMKSLLAARIGNDSAQFLSLTKQQFDLLNKLRRRRKALITGCAGSGKTALAVEKARRLARDDKMQVLLTCYNARLADALRVEFIDLPDVTVANFHALCHSLAHEAGITVDKPDGMANDVYFADYLPDQMLSAIARLPNKRYDALIVDEGQDFLPSWWIPLEELLVENPIVYIFYDDNQRLFTEPTNFPFQEEPYWLDVNCRNTQAIHKIVKSFYINPDAAYITAKGPAGERVEVYTYDSREEEDVLLAQVLERLTLEGKVNPRHITVLTRYTPQRLGWLSRTLGGVILRDQPRGPKHTLCCTIKSFKGMESPVVVLAGLGTLMEAKDETEARDSLETLLYVGISRAVSHLVVLLPKDTTRSIRKAFEE